jgi:hypothetical protein
VPPIGRDRPDAPSRPRPSHRDRPPRRVHNYRPSSTRPLCDNYRDGFGPRQRRPVTGPPAPRTNSGPDYFPAKCDDEPFRRRKRRAALTSPPVIVSPWSAADASEPVRTLPTPTKRRGHYYAVKTAAERPRRVPSPWPTPNRRGADPGPASRPRHLLMVTRGRLGLCRTDGCVTTVTAAPVVDAVDELPANHRVTAAKDRFSGSPNSLYP